MMRSAIASAASSTSAGGHDPVHQAEGVGTRAAVIGSPSTVISSATASGTPLREPDRAARGREQPALHLGEPEHRVLGRDDEVARERDLEPAGEGGAVDRGDDRLGDLTFDEAGEAAALES